jgi:hypothetical protein
MKAATVTEAVKTVLQQSGKPMSSRSIYEQIIRAGLYDFQAKDPVAVVNATLRKHCVGIDNGKSSQNKYFKLTASNDYTLV